MIDIVAKGLLSKEEMRIIAYIVRWSWGFDDGERRQDWTNKLTKRKMANDIGMAEQHVGKNINKMIKENIIIVKNGCYQFNEHFEEWKNLPKRLVLEDNKKLTEKVSKTNRKGELNLPKKLVKLTEKVSLGMPENKDKDIKNKDVRGGEQMSKDNKETIKRTLKDKGNNFIKTWKDFKTMRKRIRRPMTERAEELIIKKLYSLSDDEEEQIAILDQSTMNGWQGIFPLKKDLDTNKYTGKSKISMEEALKEMEKKNG